jgi:hypothetical protein
MANYATMDSDPVTRNTGGRMSVETTIQETEKREFEIIVNSRPHTVPSKTVTYEEVAKLAYPDWQPEDRYKVTYRKAGHGDWKLLPVGHSVEVSDGEEFVVERTHRA